MKYNDYLRTLRYISYELAQQQMEIEAAQTYLEVVVVVVVVVGRRVSRR